MDDLPPSLTVMSPDELQNKVNQEQQDNTGASAILNAVELDSELAGDGEFLKEPGKNSINFLYTFLRTSKLKFLKLDPVRQVGLGISTPLFRVKYVKKCTIFI